MQILSRHYRKRILAMVLTAATVAAAPAFGQEQFKLTNRAKLGGEDGWDYPRARHLETQVIAALSVAASLLISIETW